MNIEISPVEYERELNWHDAILYCQLLIIDNKNDWRLPTRDELNKIVNSDNYFFGTFYWSSTEPTGILGSDYAYGVNFYGQGHSYCNGKEGKFYVRAVRNI